jgi:hypothetical protein
MAMKRFQANDADIRRMARSSSIAQLPRLLPPLYKTEKHSGSQNTKGGNHKQKMERYMSALKPNIESERLGLRQMQWILLILTSERVRAFERPFKKHWQIKVDAAKRIKLEWKMYNLRKYVHMIAFVKVRSSIGWRLTMWIRIMQKTLALNKILDFLRAVAAAQNGARVLPLFNKMRMFILKAQHMVRGYMVCKHARMLLLSKKWECIEREEAQRLRSATKSQFDARMKNTGAGLVGPGKALDGVGSLDRRLNKYGTRQVVFQSVKTEKLFTKIRTASRRIQNHGYDAAKSEVLEFLLRNAREQFQSEMQSYVKKMIAGREEKQGLALEEKKQGVVSKKEIENMREMLTKGEFTDTQKISEYHLDFKMGYKVRSLSSGMRSLSEVSHTHTNVRSLPHTHK